MAQVDKNQNNQIGSSADKISNVGRNMINFAKGKKEVSEVSNLDTPVKDDGDYDIASAGNKVVQSGQMMIESADVGKKKIESAWDENQYVNKLDNVDYDYRKHILTDMQEKGSVTPEQLQYLRENDPQGYKAVTGLIKSQSQVGITSQEKGAQETYNEALTQAEIEGVQVAAMGGVGYLVMKGIELGGKKVVVPKILETAKVEEEDLVNPAGGESVENYLLVKVGKGEKLSTEEIEYIKSLPQERQERLMEAIGGIQKSNVEIKDTRQTQESYLVGTKSGAESAVETASMLYNPSNKLADKVSKTVAKAEEKLVTKGGKIGLMYEALNKGFVGTQKKVVGFLTKPISNLLKSNKGKINDEMGEAAIKVDDALTDSKEMVKDLEPQEINYKSDDVKNSDPVLDELLGTVDEEVTEKGGKVMEDVMQYDNWYYNPSTGAKEYYDEFGKIVKIEPRTYGEKFPVVYNSTVMIDGIEYNVLKEKGKVILDPGRPKLESGSANLLSIDDLQSGEVKGYLADIDMMPKKLIDNLKEGGVNVVIGNTDVPGLSNNRLLEGKPRGWDQDNMSGVKACYDPVNKIVYAGEGMGASTSPVLHEYGHAVIDLFDSTGNPKIIEAHERLYDNLGDYLKQGGPGGEAGVDEFFAESFADYIKLPKKLFVARYDEQWHGQMKEIIKNNSQ
ncbi:MAG: hypothetical protein WC570_00120 [Patescibacteria group bacterium]